MAELVEVEGRIGVVQVEEFAEEVLLLAEAAELAQMLEQAVQVQLVLVELDFEEQLVLELLLVLEG